MPELLIYIENFPPYCCSVIRELSAKALHNLTPQAPEYMTLFGEYEQSSANVVLHNALRDEELAW